MKKIFFVSLLTVSTFIVRAQQPVPSCPSVSVSCGSEVTIGESASFSANISGGDPNVTPTFNWTISNGTIESGQGTSSITVSTTDLSGSITATVDIGGYARECGTSNSCTVMLIVGAKKQTSSWTFTQPAMDFIIKEYLVFVRADAPPVQPTAFVYLYPGKTWKAAQTAKMKTQLEKAFAKNKVTKDGYKIAVGVPKAKAQYVVYSVPPGVAEPKEE